MPLKTLSYCKIIFLGILLVRAGYASLHERWANIHLKKKDTSSLGHQAGLMREKGEVLM